MVNLQLSQLKGFRYVLRKIGEMIITRLYFCLERKLYNEDAL
jgi:hypothetical protein